MKVKEVERTANTAWSPAAQFPIYIAAGTAAQQFDATFSTSAALEIYEMNLSDPDLDMQVAGSIQSDCRFNKIVWGSNGLGGSDLENGTLIGGSDHGSVFFWNPANILNNTDPLVHKLDKHTGGVGALDLNPFQHNLLASGASESEIYVWDLNNPEKPMTPGAKSQPPDDVTCVAWNRQVQHILASTYAGRCVVWDLRKNEPIIKVSDSMSRIKCKLVAWHPEVATQMCLASEDDHTPVIQLWDLRFATSPLKSLENHQRGILSIAWCPQDPDLLLSCGKDNRILCWNPNSSVPSGEVLYELPTSTQWSFDVQWCPRSPAMISSSSFDGFISVYSLMGGSRPNRPSNKIADSFATDAFSSVGVQPPAQETELPSVPLKKAPKWLRTPVGASFTFGGKLVTFKNIKAPGGHGQQQQPAQRKVEISQVITEEELVSRSNQLQNALTNNQYTEFCSMKIENSKTEEEENLWNFMKVQFEKDPRKKYLMLLGYDQADLSRKVAENTGKPVANGNMSGIDADDLADKMQSLDPNISDGDDLGSDAFDQIASQEHDNVMSDDSPLAIPTSDDFEGLVTQSLLMANFEGAVNVCLHNNKMAEAIILAIAGGPELLMRTQKKFFQKNRSTLNTLISWLVTRDFENIVRTCKLESWKEALAVALTYAKANEFPQLCDILGYRLETEQNGKLAINACLCYICAGNVEKLVSCWSKINKTSSPEALQDLVEKMMILRRAVELATGQSQEVQDGVLAEKLNQYATILASQGCLTTAYTYLGNSVEESLAVLRERLYHALGLAQQGVQQPALPFPVMNVLPTQTAQVAHQAAQPQVSAQRMPHGYQTMAGKFQTTTTPTSTYYSQTQQSHASAAAQPTITPSSYAPIPSNSGAAATHTNPLAYKYGTATQQTQVSSPYDPYAQQAGYGQAPNYMGSQAASGFPVSSSQAPAAAAQPAPFNPVSAAPVSQYTPGAPYVPPASAAQPLENQLPSFQDMRPNTAWNDPPFIKDKKKAETNYTAPAPITQPIFGAPQPEQNPPGAPNLPNQIYNPQVYQPPPQQQQQPPPRPVQQRQPEPPKPKGPIPTEHEVLQVVFDKLANHCSSAAINPQVKRKLEDVHRKLENLYDSLRANKLSANTAQGLHSIVQAIQQYDYNTALQYVTHMVSQGNFSEIGAFMPGIKMLIQTALQLQVYISQ